MKVLLLLTLFAGSAGAAEPAPFACPAPAFPSVSTSNDAIRRVESHVDEWKKCAADYEAAYPGDATHTLVQQTYDGIVEQRNRWLAATQRYASKQAASRTRPATGANGIAGVWDERNTHDMANHIKPRDADTEDASHP
jgi:hypothetical protein